MPGTPIVSVSAANDSSWRTDLPDYARPNINRIVKNVSVKAGIPGATRRTSNRFRRGLSGDMADSGSTLGQIMLAAGWKAAG